jgi:hypothetical protein
MAYMSDEALERKLEQQAAMISALIKTRSLLAAQAQEQQLLLASLAQSIEFNVSHAHGARAKRKLATDCSLESGPRMLADEAVVWRSADALGEAPIGNDMPAAEPLALGPRVAILDDLASSLHALVAVADVGQRVRELERLLNASLALV